MSKLWFKYVQGGNVPGGHNVLWDGKAAKPFIPPVREMNSIALRPSDVVVDIGAYVGTYAIRCARFPVKHVTAYEPTRVTYDVLAKTALPNLTALQAAVVGDGRKEVKLFISAGIGVTNSVVLSNRKAGFIVVPAVHYADAVAGASVVKIDVEGAEYDFPIVQPSLRAIILDIHPVPGDWIAKALRIVEGIEAVGFRPVIAPDFRNGWTRAGSWMRPLETSGEFEPMMRGRICCGCGAPVRASSKAVCPLCWERWLPKHREGYQQGGRA